ncbi:hypothetical protein QJR26_18365 (plasmid) [Clostridium baratii]
MIKKNKFLFGSIILLLISILFLTLIYFAFFWKKNISIELENNTNSTISNLKIKSNALKDTINIPQIKQNEIYKVKFNSSEKFTETEAYILLEHTTEQKQKEFFTIIGYIEKGSGENVKVILKNYENGKLIIDVNGEELTGLSEKEMFEEK